MFRRNIRFLKLATLQAGSGKFLSNPYMATKPEKLFDSRENAGHSITKKQDAFPHRAECLVPP